ncbi:MAG: sulfatase [Verrucomicrobiales bacterium]|nr:sulfatase [Verrucomicrobiales bacterium]
MKRLTALSAAALLAVAWIVVGASAAERPNILVILTDDHRHDAMGFLGHPWLETPHMDRLAREGVHFSNAFVTTSLCSPSRASILTGLYMHRHGVVDNYHAIPGGLTFFPQLLQRAGYETAFIGKWHMGGDVDDPQPGFDRWVSFKGQGVYYTDPAQSKVPGRPVPLASADGFNVDGERRPQTGYITDELTDYALDWLDGREREGRPWMLFLSHKAVHSDFLPAARHAYRYEDKPFEQPRSWFELPERFRDVPMWVKNQRNSRHGVEFAYNTPGFDIPSFYRRYCETLLAVDESLGRVMERIAGRGELDDTVILYLGDNGFLFGEHGLIDKRCAYEESMRIPMLLRAPRLTGASTGRRIEEMVANIDVAPSLLEAAGVPVPDGLDGRSFVPLVRGESVPWREELLYEYLWEHNYPQTPTMHGLRTKQYKYVRYYGIWDLDELYDLQADPGETTNLIHDPAHAERVKALDARLFELLEASGGDSLPLLTNPGARFPHRKAGGTGAAPFPAAYEAESAQQGTAGRAKDKTK